MFFIMLVIVAFILLAFVYFLPTFVAIQRNHHNCAAIFILNFFLGWSFVGWVVSMTWAMTRVVHCNHFGTRAS